MSDRKSLELLKQITRDGTYVDRIGGQDPNRAAGRQWDNRFSGGAAGGGIPKYDALNDRFCKFAMRRRAAAAAASKGTKKAPGGGQLAPLQPRRLWGNSEMPEPPRPGTSGAPTSFRGVAAPLPLPQSHARSSTPNAAGSRMGAQPGVAGADAGSSSPNMASVEALVGKARSKLARLWDELGVPDSERMAFAQQHFGGGDNSETLAALNAELQRLIEERNCAVRVEKAVEVREGFLYLLQELAERYATSSMDKERALRELQALTTPYRNASLDVVEGILRWRQALREDAQPYLWKGVSYLHKMNSDLFFLANSRLRLLLDFEVAGNPLLDPRKTADDGKKGGSSLPPLRRAPNATISSRDAALKDLPKERLDRAAAALDAEAERQRALASAAARGASESQLMSADEVAHTRGLVSEQEERQQLVVEEDAWLREQPAARSSQAIERGAATKIQAAYRAYCARRFVTAKLTQHKAAVRMQSAARRFLAKLHLQNVREQVEAARRLQALQRGIAARSRMSALRHRHTAAVCIQRTYRSHAARRATDMMRYIRDCAIAIQRVWRGHRERKEVRMVVAEGRHEAACRIQRIWRGHTVRRDPRHNASTHGKTVRLQAWFRGCLARKRAVEAALERYAATVIQARWRGVLGRRVATERLVQLTDESWAAQLDTMTQAAVRIQSAWRMVEAKAEVANIVAARRAEDEDRARAALEEARHVDDEARKLQDACATRIQATFRGHLGRQRARYVMLLNLTAIQIQRVVRGRLGRKRAAAVYRSRLVDESLAAKADDDVPSPIREAVQAFQQEQQQRQDVTAAPDVNDESVAAIAEVAQRLDMDEAAKTTPREEEEEEEVCVDVPVAVKEEQTSAAAETVVATNDTSAAPQEETTAVPHEAAPADDEPVAAVSQDAAATKIGAFYRGSTVRRTANTSRTAAIRRDRDARAQESDAAVGIVQRFAINVAARADAKRHCGLRRHTLALQRGNARGSEEAYAASVMQRAAGSWLARRATRAKVLQGYHGSASQSRAQERAAAATIIQRAARRMLSAQAVRAEQERRTVANAIQARRQEECASAARIQGFLRCADAKRVRCAKEQARAARRMLEARTEAALSIQVFGRIVAFRGRCRARASQRVSTAVLDQERAAAASVIQRCARNFAARRHARPSTLATMSGADASARTQERDYAAHVITRLHHQLQRRTRSRDRRVRAEADAVGQERDHAATLISRNTSSPTRQGRRSPPRASPRRGGAADAKGDEDAAQQEAAFAAEAIQAAARGFTARADVASQQTSATSSPQKQADAPANEKPAGKSEETVKLSTPPRQRRRSRSVQFDAATAAETRSRVLPEPQLDQSQDPDIKHEQAHAHVRSRDEQEVGAAAASASSPVSDSAAEEGDHHVQFDTAHVQVVEGSQAADHHVQFGANVPAETHSRVLPEPQLDQSQDPDIKHEHAHAHSASASPAPEAAVASNDDEHSVRFDTAHVQVVEGPQAADHHVQFGANVPAETHSRVLSEPELDVSKDPDMQHELEHAHASGSMEASAAADDGANHSVHFDTEHVAVVAAPDGELTTADAEPAAAAVETELNEYEVERRDKERRRAAALKVQCATRQRQARADLQRRRAVRTQAREQLKIADQERSATIAEEKRITEIRAIETADERREAVAATKIQCAYRCYNARFMRKWMLERRVTAQQLKAAADLQSVTNNSALKIQCLARRFLARLEIRRRRRGRDSERAKNLTEARRRESAATKIQCAYRSYNARFEFAWRLADKVARDRQEEDRRAADEAAAKEAEEAAAVENANRERAAVKIQCAHRSAAARTEVFTRRTKRHEQDRAEKTGAAEITQRMGRGYVSRVRTHTEWAKECNARAVEEGEQDMASAAVANAIDRASPIDPAKDGDL